MRVGLKRATDDAGNLTTDQAAHRLGIVFVAPYIPLSEVSSPGARGARVIDVDKVRAAITAWIDRLPTHTYDAYAYTFVDTCSDYVTDAPNARVFPGVLLAVKRRRRGTRRKRA